MWGVRVGPMSALWGQEGVAGFAVSPEPYVLEEPVGTGLGDLTGPRETEGSTGRNEAKAPTGSHAAAVGRAVAKACPLLPALRWAAVTRAGFLNLTAAAASGLPVGTGWLRPGEPGDLPSSLRSCSRGTAHPGQRLWGQSCQSLLAPWAARTHGGSWTMSGDPMRTPGELETPPEGELRARNGKGGDRGGGVAVTHSCPERTGDSGTWVLGEWATRCSGDKKGVPRAARCSRARRRGPSVIGRPAGGRGRGLGLPPTPTPASALGARAAARSRQPVGGSRREARRAQGRPAPPVPPPGRNSPAGSWDAVTPGFGNRADTQEAHLRTRLGTGP